MKMSRRRAVALAAALMVSMVPVNSYGAVITYTSKSSSSTSYSKDDEEKSGPGYQYLDDEDEEETEFAGPGVKKVSLTERYHSDYNTYEESIADLFFLYTNVANGGMTNEEVYIDIPANVLYTMEKDGVQMEYVSKQKVWANGTYVLRLTAVENPELPLSEQTEYQAVFRFRIQDKPVSTENNVAAAVQSAGSSASSTVPSGSMWGNESTAASLNLEDVKNQAEQAAKDAARDAVSGAVDKAAEGAKDAVSGAVDKAAEGAKDAMSGAVDQAAEAAKDKVNEVLSDGSESGQPGAEETGSEAKQAAAEVPRSQVYDPMRGKYVVTLENGIELVSTVPEGYVGPESVEVTVVEGVASRAELYRDDEPVEFISGNSQMEPGVYRLVLDGKSYSFTIAGQISTMDYYPAPAGMRFTEVFLEDEKQELQSDQLVTMKEDGTYTIFMEGEAGDELKVVLVKDTEAPEVLVTVNGGSAAIQYASGDIETITLEKDGAIVEGFHGTAISTPGKYRLTVADKAGNETVYEFALKYQINMYGVTAVLLCILVIVGVVVFVLHTKKNMKIR